MSAIGGVLIFDGGPVDPSLLAALGVGLERLGPDGGREVIAGSVGMTYRAFHTNAESRREHQPHCWGHQFMLGWDGRLDNRDELLTLLRDDLRGEDTDAAIVMAAYRRWGQLSIGKLLGDFALAIWDKRDHAVWLARDPIGTRTLYYHVDRDRAVWSTDLAAMIDVGSISTDVNDEYIAGYMIGGAEPDITPYLGVHAVKPAHALRIDHDGLVSEHRVWSLDPHKQIRYPSDAEYEEHFRAVFRDAVRVRLRSDSGVFAELSGGLDSSSIVCMADDIVKTGDASAPALETVSYVLDDASTSNEEQWIALVNEQRKTTGHRIYSTEHRYLTVLTDTSGIALPNFALLSSAYPRALRATMCDRRARLLLRGVGGDELLYSIRSPSPELADLAASKRVWELHARLKTWSRLMNRPYLAVLWNEAIVPNLSEPVQTWLRSGAIKFLPDWLDEGFVNRMRLRERIVVRPVGVGAFPTPSARILAQLFQGPFRSVAAGTHQELGGCENTYPYLDRRLVEYLLAIPFQQKLRPGENRSLLRRALRGILPDAILNRRDKGNPTELLYRAFARENSTFKSLLSDARIFARGYVDRTKFMAAFDRTIAGHETSYRYLAILITLELWLRAVEGRITPPNSVAAADERAALAVGTPHHATL
jgi:asparagine synthase (glutamine-hydrolysing)